jgi:hypothetical protein
MNFSFSRTAIIIGGIQSTVVKANAELNPNETTISFCYILRLF